VSVYAPTRDARGAVVDGVALEVSTADVAATQDGIPHRTIHAFVVARLLVVPVGLVAAQVATSSITRLTDAAVQVAEGDYDAHVRASRQGRFRDQVGGLAGVLDDMTTKVAQRERSLRHEVQESRIEIDETKRRQQVDEIVETDFFRDLQAEAQAQRRRRRGGVDEEDGAGRTGHRPRNVPDAPWRSDRPVLGASERAGIL
jgi:HAMP domain-containing protein